VECYSFEINVYLCYLELIPTWHSDNYLSELFGYFVEIYIC
jgi:hypothetical protein